MNSIFSRIDNFDLSKKRKLSSGTTQEKTSNIHFDYIFDDFVPKRRIDIEANFDLNIVRFLLSRNADNFHAQASSIAPLLQNLKYWKYPSNKLLLSSWISSHSSNADILRNNLHSHDYWALQESNENDIVSEVRRRKLEWQAAIYSALDSLLYNDMKYLYYIPSSDVNAGGRTIAYICKLESTILNNYKYISKEFLQDDLSLPLCSILIGASTTLINKLSTLKIDMLLISKDDISSIIINKKDTTILSSLGNYELAEAGKEYLIIGNLSVKLLIDCLADAVLSPSSGKISFDVPTLISNTSFTYATMQQPIISSYYDSFTIQQHSIKEDHNDVDLGSAIPNTGTNNNNITSNNNSNNTIKTSLPNTRKCRIQLTGFFFSSNIVFLCHALSYVASTSETNGVSNQDSNNNNENNTSKKNKLMLFSKILSKEDIQIPPNISINNNKMKLNSSSSNNNNLYTNGGTTMTMSSTISAANMSLKNPMVLIKSVVRDPIRIDITDTNAPSNPRDDKKIKTGADSSTHPSYTLKMLSVERMEYLSILQKKIPNDGNNNNNDNNNQEEGMEGSTSTNVLDKVSYGLSSNVSHEITSISWTSSSNKVDKNDSVLESGQLEVTSRNRGKMYVSRFVQSMGNDMRGEADVLFPLNKYTPFADK